MPSKQPEAPDSADGEASEKSGGSYCAACHRSVAREDRFERAGEVYHRGCAPDDAAENRRLDNPAWKDRLQTDGGLDAETVLGTVDPGDVVEVTGSPYRVVDVDAEEGDGVLRLYDLVEKRETIKAAGAGDVTGYCHRSEHVAIANRVEQERERRDVQEDDVDEGGDE